MLEAMKDTLKKLREELLAMDADENTESIKKCAQHVAELRWAVEALQKQIASVLGVG